MLLLFKVSQKNAIKNIKLLRFLLNFYIIACLNKICMCGFYRNKRNDETDIRKNYDIYKIEFFNNFV